MCKESDQKGSHMNDHRQPDNHKAAAFAAVLYCCTGMHALHALGGDQYGHLSCRSILPLTEQSRESSEVVSSHL